MLKKQFLDAMKRQGKTTLSGQHWYGTQATRAVNQAIGRVIRHQYDHGAIIFADTRFRRTQHQLPVWLRQHTQSFDVFGSAQKGLTSFFRNVPAKRLASDPSVPESNTKVLSASSSASIVSILLSFPDQKVVLWQTMIIRNFP